MCIVIVLVIVTSDIVFKVDKVLGVGMVFRFDMILEADFAHKKMRFT